MLGVEPEFLPALVAWGEDLHDQRGGREPHAGCSGPVQASVGHAEVVLGLAEVELVHHGKQPAGARRGAKELGELLRYAPVFEAGAWDHVQDTLPDLIETVHARAAAALKQRLQLRWR